MNAQALRHSQRSKSLVYGRERLTILKHLIEEEAAGVRSCTKGRMHSICVPNSKVCYEYET